MQKMNVIAKISCHL